LALCNPKSNSHQIMATLPPRHARNFGQLPLQPTALRRHMSRLKGKLAAKQEDRGCPKENWRR
jgi:hypothetical protein